MSIDNVTDKENVAHTHVMKYYSAHKEEENPAICDNMDQP